MTALANITALEARLGQTITGTELTIAEAALDDASAVVRTYGLPWPDPATAPAVAISITIAAAERRVRNPEGYRMEMQGAYKYARAASAPLGVELTHAEIRMLRAALGISGVYSVPIEGIGGTL